MNPAHVYEIRPRKDDCGVNLISDVLPLRCAVLSGGPDAISNAIDYAKFYSRSHNAIIRVYDEAGNVIKTQERTAAVDANGNKMAVPTPQAMLNEFLKGQKRIAELETTVAQQTREMEVLTAQFKEHVAQIQRVSTQLETRKPTPQIVDNNR
jgi:alpha-D-ribose 1-methylphosphonate 5-phosphate C-P lyase